MVSPTDSFIQRFSALSEATPQRGRDVVLRALDITLSAFFLLVTLPLTVPIALLLLMTGGPPLFYCGERVGRGGRIFQMRKFAQVRRGYETSMAEKLAHDLEWIADRSVRLYLRTLATTAWRVLGQFVRGLAGRG